MIPASLVAVIATAAIVQHVPEPFEGQVHAPRHGFWNLDRFAVRAAR